MTDRQQLFDALAAHAEWTEHGYRTTESNHVMTDEQLAVMNQALGLEKDRTYRPYCLARGCCDMPRMELHPFGFRCPACHNQIGFNLERL